MLIIKNRIQEHLLLVQTMTIAVKGTLTWRAADHTRNNTDTYVQVKKNLKLET